MYADLLGDLLGSGSPTLNGSFRFEPPPTGLFEARLTSPSEIAAGVRIQLLPGPIPGLYLENTSGETLIVLGEAGEPFVKIGPEGTHANVISPTWQQSGQAEVAAEPMAADGKAQPQWVFKSPAQRFSWLEPRAAYPQREPPARILQWGVKAEVLQWAIPMRYGTADIIVSGATDWTPNKP